MGVHPFVRYLVLARREYVESLSYQGMLEAGTGQDPGRLAVDRFGAGWLELVLAPEGAVRWVIEPGTPLETAT